MILRLLTLPTWLLGLGIVGLAVAATVLGGRLSGSWVKARPEDPAVVALHATVSTIYTVLLAFVVVIVWQQFTDASDRVDTEATRLSNLWRDSRAFPDADRESMQDAIHEYIRLTTTREWPAMAAGTAPDPSSSAAFERIWEVVYKKDPKGPREEAFYGEMLTRLNELGAARRLRLLSARASVPGVLWLLLVGGGMVVVALSYLLPTQSGRGRNLALAATSCVIALTLFLILVLNHPYSGDIQVDKSALTDLLTLTRQSPAGR
jgi:hypothetical protein